MNTNRFKIFIFFIFLFLLFFSGNKVYAGSCLQNGRCTDGFNDSAECESLGGLYSPQDCAPAGETGTPAAPAAAPKTVDYTYIPMEEIPGFGRPTDFPTYLMSVYKFGLWTVGLAAMLMIIIGGYTYLTSAGNNATKGTAKKIITDAIAGLILALVSWILLYAINPELVEFRNTQVQPITQDQLNQLNP